MFDFREEHPVEQIKPPSIFDHGEMKEEYYDSYHAQKNPDAYIGWLACSAQWLQRQATRGPGWPAGQS